MKAPARVVVTCPTFEPGFRGGGPVKSVAQIIDSAPSDLDVVLITSDRDLGASDPYPALSGRWVRRATASVFYLSRRSPAQWARLIVALRRRPIKLLYVNSLWEPYFSVAPIALSVLGIIPAKLLLIAPRGELSQAALAIKARKKRWFLRFWRPVLGRANLAWHASTESEASDISACFPGSNIIVCSDRARIVTVASAHSEADQGRPTRFISIGRISPIKNLHVAIEALASLSNLVTFDIFGPIEDEKYWAECQRKIAVLPASVSVGYRGELNPSDVADTFARYDAFVFPTLSENFGHVVAESLAAACPVICSDRTPWTAVLADGGGQVIASPTSATLGPVLKKWANMSRRELVESSRAAHDAFLRWSSELDESHILDLALRRPE